MRLDRRRFLSGLGASAVGLNATYQRKDQAKKAGSSAPDVHDLDRAAAAPVLKLDGLKSPAIIESIRLLKKDD